MAIEIVDFPMNSMVIFHSYVNVYQKVKPSMSFGVNRVSRLDVPKLLSQWVQMMMSICVGILSRLGQWSNSSDVAKSKVVLIENIIY